MIIAALAIFCTYWVMRQRAARGSFLLRDYILLALCWLGIVNYTFVPPSLQPRLFWGGLLALSIYAGVKTFQRVRTNWGLLKKAAVNPKSVPGTTATKLPGATVNTNAAVFQSLINNGLGTLLAVIFSVLFAVPTITPEYSFIRLPQMGYTTPKMTDQFKQAEIDSRNSYVPIPTRTPRPAVYNCNLNTKFIIRAGGEVLKQPRSNATGEARAYAMTVDFRRFLNDMSLIEFQDGQYHRYVRTEDTDIAERIRDDIVSFDEQHGVANDGDFNPIAEYQRRCS